MEVNIKLSIDDRIVRAFRAIRRLMSRRVLTIAGLVGVIGATTLTWAAVQKPHTFNAGGPIVAAQVNENFDRLYETINGR